MSNVERTCANCGCTETPLWRRSPLGPKTLCNACGVRMKKGRLVFVPATNSFMTVESPNAVAKRQRKEQREKAEQTTQGVNKSRRKHNPESQVQIPDIVSMRSSTRAAVGCPTSFGTVPTQLGTNFAIYARSDDVTLILADDSGTQEYPLDPAINRTGHVWHVEIIPPVPGFRYLWRVGEKDPRWCCNECLDPWARVLHVPVGASLFNARKEDYAPWAVVPTSQPFDWQGITKPKIPWSQLVIYEIHVRGFTKRVSEIGGSTVTAGSYTGVVKRIPYLKALGINCVELLPIMEFNETEWSHISPVTGKPLCLYWGYSTVAFFAPMARFAKHGSKAIDVVDEFKYMIRELHRAGIEVIMDVVYNHTAEMGLDYVGRGFYGMKQLAPFSYYLLQDNGQTFINHSGCGNTLNCNNVAVQEMIHESLRYWAHEMQVDGFRFDLASILCRGTDGEPLSKPPLIERVTKDPTMRDVKLIAEPWDCGGLYQVGSFPHYGAWAEWNGKFRDCVRRFVRGDPGMIGEFATRMCGSQDLYDSGRKPYHSINFVTAHDGFSLWDLVSYNNKHNDQNGENNNDGEAHNFSWNCGAEGHTDNMDIQMLRRRQIKNFLVALFVATGTPMLAMGDEYGHTKHGNNNGWCQDSELTWFDWQEARARKDDLLLFTQLLVHFRRTHKTLHKEHFLSEKDVTWHGVKANKPDWNSKYNFIAFSLRGDVEIYAAFNAGSEDREVELPRVDGQWARVVDTNLPPPKTCCIGDGARKLDGKLRYGLGPFSCLVLRQIRGTTWNETVDALGAAFSDRV